MQLSVLFVHYWIDGVMGGAERSLLGHVNNAPKNISVTMAHAEDQPDLSKFDVVVVGSVRPPGDYRQWDLQSGLARRWTDAIRAYGGLSIRSERDLHPCGRRDAACIRAGDCARFPCQCPPFFNDIYQAFFNAFAVVQFLSPGHRSMVRALIDISQPAVVIAPPVDLASFRIVTPAEQRSKRALVFEDDARMAKSSLDRARRAGFEPDMVPYLSVPYDQMPELLNQYAAVVVDPVMYHAFGRLVVEAQACGCQILASDRVGAMTWADPIAAVQASNFRFWSVVESVTLSDRDRRRLLRNLEA